MKRTVDYELSHKKWIKVGDLNNGKGIYVQLSKNGEHEALVYAVAGDDGTCRYKDVGMVEIKQN
ncbi:hypothetical protein ABEY43_06240 [Priestia megaterium]